MYAFGLGILAAFLTAFYSWRLLFLTFHGKPRADEKVMAHVHEAPAVMWVPLVGLAIGAVVIGYLMLPMVATDIDFWGTSILVLPIHNALEEAHHVDFWVKALPMAVGVLGIGGAFLFYVLRPELPGMLATRARPVYLFLLNKWYFDELYEILFVRSAKYLGPQSLEAGRRRRDRRHRAGMASPRRRFPSHGAPSSSSQATSITTPSRCCWVSRPS